MGYQNVIKHIRFEYKVWDQSNQQTQTYIFKSVFSFKGITSRVCIYSICVAILLFKITLLMDVLFTNLQWSPIIVYWEDLYYHSVPILVKRYMTRLVLGKEEEEKEEKNYKRLGDITMWLNFLCGSWTYSEDHSKKEFQNKFLTKSSIGELDVWAPREPAHLKDITHLGLSTLIGYFLIYYILITLWQHFSVFFPAFVSWKRRKIMNSVVRNWTETRVWSLGPSQLIIFSQVCHLYTERFYTWFQLIGFCLQSPWFGHFFY